MTLESLKEDYKRTFTEPRLSGRLLPEERMEKFSNALKSSKTLDDFIDSLRSSLNDKEEEMKNETEEETKKRRREVSYHILLRILTWNDESPVILDDDGITWKKIEK